MTTSIDRAGEGQIFRYYHGRKLHDCHYVSLSSESAKGESRYIDRFIRISVTMLSRLILNLRMENERMHRGGLSTFSLSRAVFAPQMVAITSVDVRDVEGYVGLEVSGYGELESNSSDASTDV